MTALSYSSMWKGRPTQGPGFACMESTGRRISLHLRVTSNFTFVIFFSLQASPGCPGGPGPLPGRPEGGPAQIGGGRSGQLRDWRQGGPADRRRRRRRRRAGRGRRRVRRLRGRRRRGREARGPPGREAGGEGGAGGLRLLHRGRDGGGRVEAGRTSVGTAGEFQGRTDDFMHRKLKRTIWELLKAIEPLQHPKVTFIDLC